MLVCTSRKCQAVICQINTKYRPTNENKVQNILRSDIMSTNHYNNSVYRLTSIKCILYFVY